MKFKLIFQQSTIYIIGLVISGIGLAIQLTVLTKNFLQRDVVFDSLFNLPPTLTVPDLMICTKFVHTLKYERIFAEMPKLFKNVCTAHDMKECLKKVDKLEMIEKKFVDASTLDTAHRYLLKSSEIVQKVEYGGHSFRQSNRQDCSILDHIIFPESCITITCRNNSEAIRVSRNGHGFSFFHAIMRISMNTTLMQGATGLRVIVTPTRNSPTTPEGSGSIVKVKSNGIVRCQISYRRTVVERLPPPYKTMCRNYSKSRELDNCLNNAFIQQYKSPCPGRFIHPDQYLGRRLRLKPEMSFGWESTYQKCVQDLPEECTTVNYVSQLQNQDVMEDAGKVETSIDIMVPTEYDLVMFAIPSVGISQFLILCGSIIGTWYGVSIFSILISLMEFLRKIWIGNDRDSSTSKINRRRDKLDPRLFRPSMNFKSFNVNRDNTNWIRNRNSILLY